MKSKFFFSGLSAILLATSLTACSTNTTNQIEPNSDNSITPVIQEEEVSSPIEYSTATQVTDDWKFVYDEKLGGIKILDCLCVQRKGGSRVYNSVADVVVPTTFEGFEGLEVLEIGNGAFSYFEDCNSITLPDTLKYIDSAVFASSNIKQTVVIPDSVIDISEKVFYAANCNIQLPSNLEKIGEYWFGYAQFTHIEIPASVEEIEKFAFYGCTELTEITIGENVKTIGECAFADCLNLEKVTFNSRLKEIGKKAFSSCHDLKEIEFKEGLEKIGENAFINSYV